MIKFPYIHFILAQIISFGEVRVKYSNQFLSQNDDSSNDGLVDEVDDPDEPDYLGPNKLMRREKGILEYFLVMTCLCSQKKLPYCSMVTPLCFFICGYNQPDKKSHTNVANCTLETTWIYSNQLFYECTANSTEMI